MIVEKSTIIFYSILYFILTILNLGGYIMRPILTYEQQYLTILRDIRKYGYRQLNTRTGYDTLRIPHEVIQVDLQEEFPILQCKEVLWKSAMEEILWIMQKR